MEITNKLLPLLMYILVTSCASNQNAADIFSDVYVEDFYTEDMSACKPADVDLNNDEARQFFLRSTKVDYKIIHDHYNVAPCHIEGLLKTSGQVCDWKIQASAVGSIKCNGETSYYVCDSCDDLFD